MTKLLGVIGDPISHSLSPLIHNGWLRDHHINASYEAMHVQDGEFSEALKTLESKDIVGVNVTLPHKHAALASASQATEAAARIGAANTLSFKGADTWHADNTDAPGFMRTLEGVDPDKDHVLVLGAGGSARAIVFALTNEGVPLTILNRTLSKATELAQELGAKNAGSASLDQYANYIENATIVINTTSMGYGGEILSLPAGRDRTFFDISYGKIAAPQIEHAISKGWRVKDGLTMLVAQAAYSFEIWFGEMPNLDAGLRRCQNALKAVS